MVMDCLQQHGFLINLEKSKLHPTQRIQHLWMILDSQRMKVFLTPTQIMKTGDMARSVLRHRMISLMALTQLLGLMVANMEALQWGGFHSRELQWFLTPYQQQIAAKVDLKLHIQNWVKDGIR